MVTPRQNIVTLARAVVFTIAVAAIFACPALAWRAGPPQNPPITGVVRDQTGAAIAGAEVRFRSGSFTASETTDDQGRFSIELTPAIAAGSVAVSAPGFADAERTWNAREADSGHLELVLAPASLSERITVTATRTRMRAADTAADTIVLGPEDLAATAALTLDDSLRQVPGFTLFRRSGSRVANPTSQGVSLRGVGASGASRALVLEDGIPLDDPFGSWVYWDRVARQSVSAVELVRGGAALRAGAASAKIAPTAMVKTTPRARVTIFCLGVTIVCAKKAAAPVISFGGAEGGPERSEGRISQVADPDSERDSSLRSE